MREIHKRRRNNIKELILNHIYDNIKIYLFVIIIFIIGIILGVVFTNNIAEEQYIEIKDYITNFVNSLKQDYTINTTNLLKKTVTNNIILSITMWFIGSTVIGIPIVLGIVIFRGFCIGYTLSSIIAVLGVQKGLLFIITTMLLQNIIFIPVIICMTISCIKLYKSIMKDKRKENIKIEIVKHTLVSLILSIFLILEAFIETYISTNLLMLVINFF